MHPSTALARVLVDALVRGGVREAVLAPGSRSAPLAFALHDAAAYGRLRLHVRIDERSAAFLALGLARGCEPARPVAVVTTSGSAVANLHPAVLEAHHAGVPLVLLTADRPPELRGVGANQTTDQVGIFGAAVREMVDLAVPRREPGQVRYWRDVVSRAVVAATGLRSNDPGPVHLNVGLADPLVPDGDDTWVEPIEPAAPRDLAGSAPAPVPVELPAGARTVVLAGDGAGSNARWLAQTGGWPLLAEPSSGARGGPNAVGPYRLLLETPGLGADIERVIAYGRPTLSRPVTRLLARDTVELVIVTTLARWADPARRAATVLGHPVPPASMNASRLPVGVEADPGGAAGSGRAEADAWLTRWIDAGTRAHGAIDRVLSERPLSGPAVARAVAAHLRAGDLLIVGSSNPIRDLDLTMTPDQSAPVAPVDGGDQGAAGGIRVVANRGLAGIDGTVSTAVGAALAWQAEAGGDGPVQPRARRAYALVGDLTFLHDSNGLVIGPSEAQPNLVIVVLNDDGGGIFHTLEPGAAAHAASFERVFGTPHGVDLAALCAATRTPHVRVETAADLTDALVRADRRAEGIRVVEARVDRSGRRDLEAELRQAVAAAVAEG